MWLLKGSVEIECKDTLSEADNVNGRSLGFNHRCSHLACIFFAVWMTVGVPQASLAQDQVISISQKPLPPGVFQSRGISANGGIIQLKDGSLMLANGRSYRLSTDGGRNWDQGHPLQCAIGAAGLIRLQSGALAIYGRKDNAVYFASSMDEGKTWSEPTQITDYPDFGPLFHSMIQLKSGRLLLTGHWGGLYSWDYRDGTMVSVHPDLQYLDVSSFGLWRGKKIQIEGHGHAPEMGISVVFRSDDQGQTWKKHPGGLMGWFDFEGRPNGNGGQTSCFEPTIAETRDGNVLFLARSTVGRLVQSFSTDGGEHWYAVVPSDLPSSESPALMVTLPPTGDLLIIWNQMSREEIRRGYRRGRLSSAISTDGGHSWEKFKTLELSEGLEDVDRVPPEYPIQMVRARDWVGPLPDRWAYFHYPNVDVVGDKVFVRYAVGSPLLGVAEQNLQKQGSILRIYPMEWFYE